MKISKLLEDYRNNKKPRVVGYLTAVMLLEAKGYVFQMMKKGDKASLEIFAATSSTPINVESTPQFRVYIIDHHYSDHTLIWRFEG